MWKLRKFALTLFWQKFREATFLLNSWFDEIFFRWEWWCEITEISFYCKNSVESFHLLITVWNSTIKCDHYQEFPWNQLFSNFFSKIVDLTEKSCFFRKHSDRSCFWWFSTLCWRYYEITQWSVFTKFHVKWDHWNIVVSQFFLEIEYFVKSIYRFYFILFLKKNPLPYDHITSILRKKLYPIALTITADYKLK